MYPSERIDQLIAELTDWRGKTLASIRKSILEADREIIEEWKWMGSPVWSHDGMIAVGNAHKELFHRTDHSCSSRTISVRVIFAPKKLPPRRSGLAPRAP